MHYKDINEGNVAELSAKAPGHCENAFRYLFQDPIGRYRKVGQYLLERTDVEKQKIFDYYSQRSDSDFFSTIVTGFLYWCGIGVEREFLLAEDCFSNAKTLSCEKDSANMPYMPEFMMGLFFEKTEYSVEQEAHEGLEKAVECYKDAVAKGCPLPEGYINALEADLEQRNMLELDDVIEYSAEEQEQSDRIDEPQPSVQATPNTSPSKDAKRKFGEFGDYLESLLESNAEKGRINARLVFENQDLGDSVEKYKVTIDRQAAIIADQENKIKRLKTSHQEAEKAKFNSEKKAANLETKAADLEKKVINQQITIRELASELTLSSSKTSSQPLAPLSPNKVVMFSLPRKGKGLVDGQEKDSTHSKENVASPNL